MNGLPGIWFPWIFLLGHMPFIRHVKWVHSLKNEISATVQFVRVWHFIGEMDRFFPAWDRKFNESGKTCGPGIFL